MATDDELLASNPAAQSLIDAGVPREEVLAGLRQASHSTRNSFSDSHDVSREDSLNQLRRTPSMIPTALPAGWEERVRSHAPRRRTCFRFFTN